MKALIGMLMLSACAAGAAQPTTVTVAGACPPPVTQAEVYSPPAVAARQEYYKVAKESIAAIQRARSPRYVEIVQAKQNAVADRLEALIKQDGHPTKKAIAEFYAASRDAVTTLKTVPVDIGNQKP